MPAKPAYIFIAVSVCMAMLVVGLGLHDDTSAVLRARFHQALWKGLNGGIAGSLAMIFQVAALMWLRTAVNVQLARNVSIKSAFATLWQEGGVPRFYRGLGAALVQGPLSRFGDAFAIESVDALLRSASPFGGSPAVANALRAFVSAVVAATWRAVLLPVDAYKTNCQVFGQSGARALLRRVSERGVATLWAGGGAVWVATVVASLPWMFVYASLNSAMSQCATCPVGCSHSLVGSCLACQLGRHALIGFVSSVISDVAANPFRVLKTRMQCGATGPYAVLLSSMLKEEGLLSFWCRGLGLRVVTNSVQSALFTFLWRFASSHIVPCYIMRSDS